MELTTLFRDFRVATVRGLTLLVQLGLKLIDLCGESFDLLAELRVTAVGFFHLPPGLAGIPDVPSGFRTGVSRFKPNGRRVPVRGFELLLRLLELGLRPGPDLNHCVCGFACLGAQRFVPHQQFSLLGLPFDAGILKRPGKLVVGRFRPLQSGFEFVLAFPALGILSKQTITLGLQPVALGSRSFFFGLNLLILVQQPVALAAYEVQCPRGGCDGRGIQLGEPRSGLLKLGFKTFGIGPTLVDFLAELIHLGRLDAQRLDFGEELVSGGARLGHSVPPHRCPLELNLGVIELLLKRAYLGLRAGKQTERLAKLPTRRVRFRGPG